MSFPLRLDETEYEVHHFLIALRFVRVPLELQPPQRRFQRRPGEQAEFALDARNLAGGLGLLQVRRRTSSLGQRRGEERRRGLARLGVRCPMALLPELDVRRARVLVALQLRRCDDLSAEAAVLVVRKGSLGHILAASWAETRIRRALLLVVDEILGIHDFFAETAMPMIGVRLLLHHRAARCAVDRIHLAALLMILELLRAHHELAEAAMPMT